VKNRCTKAHEYVFLFAKSQSYYFDAAAIAEPSKYAGKMVVYDDNSKNRTGVPASLQTRPRQTMQVAEMRNRRSVWSVGVRKFTGAHLAVWPLALVEPCILAGCPQGGVVLDPFIGTGTTAVVAQQNGRQCIGFELNPDYFEYAIETLQGQTE
jgi:site-specific DNA-methyltransferase (adenine-specific)